MCLAILIPKNHKLPREHAEIGFLRNSQGAGFAYAEDGKVHIRKGFFRFDEFWSEFDVIQRSNNGPFLVHFRVATCGPVNEDNCHPWAIDDRQAFIHNGTINEFATNCSNISDTGNFVNILLKPLLAGKDKIFIQPWFIWLLNHGVPSFNKFAMIDGDGQIAVYNTKNWTLFAGIYYSNHSFEPLSKKEKKKRGHEFRFGAGDYEAAEDFYNGRHWSMYGKRNNEKTRKRNPKYRLKGKKDILTPREVNHLTHKKFGGYKRIKDMVEAGLVEKVYPDEEPEDKKSVEYRDWWVAAKDKRIGIYSRKDLLQHSSAEFSSRECFEAMEKDFNLKQEIADIMRNDTDYDGLGC